MLRTLLALALAPLALAAQSAARHQSHAPLVTPAEQRASRAFASAAKAGPLPLHAFLQKMPKGADLHMHLSGAVYAETFLREAAADNLCIDTTRLALVKPTAAACPTGSVPAATAFKDQHIYDEMIDSVSMRAFVPTPGTSGHDQFFATFDRLHGIERSHTGEQVDEVATRAAAQNEQYLELMVTPTFTHAATLGYQLGWPGTPHPVSTAASSTPYDTTGTTPAELSAIRDKLLAGGLREDITADNREFAEALAARNKLEHCNTPAALPACTVQVRFLYQVLRAFPPQQVFAQTLLAFEVASQDPDVVGINYVQPEDAYMAMSEYPRQMRMLDYLHSVYPQVHISLHAGELAPGLVPPAGLAFHIRQAVELGHAQRIGHGVDVMYETDPQQLLEELAARHVVVEINLTSNDVILGVSANHHSLPDYLAAHVPVALSTDDEGVSRIDLTHEYTRAAVDFGLTYLDLKRIARTSLEHAFVPGPSLWQTPDDFTRPIPACVNQALGTETPTESCAAFLRESPRATQQWELEHRYKLFESTL